LDLVIINDSMLSPGTTLPATAAGAATKPIHGKRIQISHQLMPWTDALKQLLARADVQV
jgi:hypothetical protein